MVSASERVPLRGQLRWPDGRLVAFAEYRAYRIGMAIVCPTLCTMTWLTGLTLGSDFDNAALAVVLLVALTLCLLGSITISRIRLAALTGDRMRAVDVLRRLHLKPRWPDGRYVSVTEDRLVKTLQGVTLMLAPAISLVCGLVGIPKVDFTLTQIRRLNSLVTAIASANILVTVLRVKVLQRQLIRAKLASR